MRLPVLSYEFLDGLALGLPGGSRRCTFTFTVTVNDDDAWYVLEGSLCVRVGKEVVEAYAGGV